MTDHPGRRSRVPPAFPSLAYLYQPADPSVEVAIVEADLHWSRPTQPEPGVAVLLWGRLARNARPTAASALDGLRREIALRRVTARPPTGFGVAESHRLPPVSRPGVIRRRIRAFTLGGALLRFTRGSGARADQAPRVIDAVVEAAGADPRGVRLRPSGDGSALARLALADGTAAELRVAKAGHTKDPARGHAALVRLAEAGVSLVPRPLGGGITAGAAWSTETAVPGDHVADLTPALLGEITAFLATLPAGAGDRAAIDDRLAEVADFFPEHAAALHDVAAAAARWASGLGPVLVHGDLWLNNLFTIDGRLSAVFDWDTWHPAGLPGSDLLNLLAADERTRSRRDIGPLLIDDFWQSPDVVDALRAAFRARGEPAPDAAGVAAIATDWWASRVAGALHRALRQIDDPAWTRRNLVDALPRFERLIAELG